MGSISIILQDSKCENYCASVPQGLRIQQVPNSTNKNIQ